MSVVLTRRPLSVPAAYRRLLGPTLGGIVVFAGRVRDDTVGGGVSMENTCSRVALRSNR